MLVLCSALLAPAESDGTWLQKVPGKERLKANPYHERPEAIAAGQRLFADHCASCHGKSAEGSKKRPSLRSERVQKQATEGDLHWLLVNGNRWKGMPSWSKLPDQQLWQLTAFVKSLHD